MSCIIIIIIIIIIITRQSLSFLINLDIILSKPTIPPLNLPPDNNETEAARAFHAQLVHHKQRKKLSSDDRTQSYSTLDKITEMIHEFSRDVDE